jgi:AcrR family transcriptional regulator
MPRETLTRDQVVTAAIAIVDSEGFDALSMRRLAQRLGTAAPTLYWHVHSRDELLDLLVDEVTGEVLVAMGSPVGWRASMACLAVALREVLARHPGVVPILGLRPPAGANAGAALDRLLGALRDDGFSGTDAALAAVTLTEWATAFAVFEAQGRAAGGSAAAAGLPSADERFTFGLEVLLDGIEARRHRARGPKAPGDTLPS